MYKYYTLFALTFHLNSYILSIGDPMKKQIENILKNYDIAYSFLSVDKYVTKRKALLKQDVFSDYEQFYDYQTIITIGVPYPSKKAEYKGRGYGILSRYSYGTDYHIVLRRLLESISSKLKELGIRNYPSVDISFIDERYAGYLSGLGYLGKNQFLIHKTYGSYIYLATILIDCEIEDVLQDYDSCKDCRKCIDACPSNALDNGFDESKCISSLSQSKKAFEEHEIKYFKTMIYGCDICQVVCPKNKGVDFHLYPEFEADGRENILIKDLLNMSNKEYHQKYGNNASSWKGATVIKRNAMCLIASQGLVELKDEITKNINDFHDVLWYNETARKVLKMLDRE